MVQDLVLILSFQGHVVVLVLCHLKSSLSMRFRRFRFPTSFCADFAIRQLYI